MKIFNFEEMKKFVENTSPKTLFKGYSHYGYGNPIYASGKMADIEVSFLAQEFKKHDWENDPTTKYLEYFAIKEIEEY